jgi:hypothetical protein
MACFAELVLARERGKAIFPVQVQPCEARGVFSDIQHIDLTVEPEEGYRRLGLDPQDVSGPLGLSGGGGGDQREAIKACPRLEGGLAPCTDPVGRGAKPGARKFGSRGGSR